MTKRVPHRVRDGRRTLNTALNEPGNARGIWWCAADRERARGHTDWASETVTTMLQALRSTIVLTAVVFSSAATAADVDQGRAAFAAAFRNVKGTLEGGLKAAGRVGRPVSARFVLEDGTLQLSLWIVKDDEISEFNLYPAIRTINEVMDITDPDKIKAATAQKLAIDSATCLQPRRAP